MTDRTRKALLNGPVFNGETLLKQHAVVISDGRIETIVPGADIDTSAIETIDLQGHCLVPGFIDLQVNGGGGIMFNSAPTVETIRTMVAGHRKYGTTGLLPTLITTSFEVMAQAIAAVEQAMFEGVPGVLGIHLEGPFLNAEKKGAHDADKFCVLDEQGVALVSSLKQGKTIATIAPELTSPEIIAQLKSRGVIICAGHSNADYRQARQALDAGIDGFTHLYNAMTPLQSREPGMVGAALEDHNSWFGIIADGYHMHPAAFAVAVGAKQQGGAVLVTDAMSTVGAKEKSFVLDGETIHSVDGRCVNAAGSLAGSDLDMMSAVNNAAEFANIDWFEAVRMASLYPAQALGLDGELGRIKPGYRASFVLVNSERQVVNTWVDGEPLHSPS
ncbi:MAG: N-acetylglucosamine-6-phosphate deacetylase [Porticoccaceae bacterium]|nr:N-acetylglucosamine-6-phosphate deacetylase [Porticoccaceae bacterium]